MASIVAANSVAAGRRGGLAVVLLAAVLRAP
jgi:hypothetical protein